MDPASYLTVIIALGQATTIICHGAIFDWLPRHKFQILRCSMCAGFWIGVIGSVFNYKLLTLQQGIALPLLVSFIAMPMSAVFYHCMDVIHRATGQGQ